MELPKRRDAIFPGADRDATDAVHISSQPSGPIKDSEALLTVRTPLQVPLVPVSLLLGVCPAVVVLMSDRLPGLEAPLAAGLCSLVSLGGLMASAWCARRRQAYLKIEQGGVSLNGRLLAASSALSCGYVQPTRESHVSVRVYGRRRRISFEVELPNLAEGERFLRTLALDAEHRDADLYGPSWLLASTTRALLGVSGVVISCLAMIHFLGAIWWLPFASTFTVLGLYLVALAIPSRFRVGAEGVEVTWLWLKQFHAYNNVEQFTLENDAIVLRAPDGREARLETGGTVTASARPSLRDAVHVRISAARAASRRRAARATDPLSLLERAEAESWILGLKELGQVGAAGLELDDAQLWCVFEDPTEPARKRAAAAYVLRLRVPGEGAERLRSVAQSTSDQSLRRVLEHLANSPIDEAEKTLRNSFDGPTGARDRTAQSP